MGNELELATQVKLEELITAGIILNGNITGIDELHKTGKAVVYKVNGDIVEEKMFYLYDVAGTITYKELSLLS